MDRPGSIAAALLPGIDDASVSGWDAHAVWQERVRNPHVLATHARSAPRTLLEERTSGWDPIETWRLRVQRPRKNIA